MIIGFIPEKVGKEEKKTTLPKKESTKKNTVEKK